MCFGVSMAVKIHTAVFQVMMPCCLVSFIAASYGTVTFYESSWGPVGTQLE